MSSISSTSQEASSNNENTSIENSVLLLTRHKLTGQNYIPWARSMMMFITGKGKEDYLTDSFRPQPDDPRFKKWKAENQMVMSWLINSMDIEVGQNFMFYDTAAEIWRATKESYSDVENTAELFEIKGALHDLKQGELSVSQYFNSLNRYWQQLDMFECSEWKCTEDAATYQKLVEKERIYKFLLGLNKSLDEVRGRILSKKPLPSLREVFSTVRHEESRKKLMLGPLSDSNSTEGFALAIHGVSRNSENGKIKGRLWCEFVIALVISKTSVGSFMENLMTGKRQKGKILLLDLIPPVLLVLKKYLAQPCLAKSKLSGFRNFLIKVVLILSPPGELQKKVIFLELYMFPLTHQNFGLWIPELLIICQGIVVCLKLGTLIPKVIRYGLLMAPCLMLLELGKFL